MASRRLLEAESKIASSFEFAWSRYLGSGPRVSARAGLGTFIDHTYQTVVKNERPNATLCFAS